MTSEILQRASTAAELPAADIKIILLGDSAVGKSKLVERFLVNDYIEKQLSTFALTLYRHVSHVEGRELHVDIWDTAGQECFQSLHPSYYFGAHACILVFDITRQITYKNLKTWYVEMRASCPKIPCVLIANKIDVDIDVTRQRFKFPEVYKLPFYFVSAADGTNVVKIFQDVISLALQFKSNPPDSFESDIMSLLEEDDWLTS